MLHDDEDALSADREVHRPADAAAIS